MNLIKTMLLTVTKLSGKSLKLRNTIDFGTKLFSLYPTMPRHSPFNQPSSAGTAPIIISPFRIVNSSDDLAV